MAKEAEVRYQSWEELIQDVRSQVVGRETLDYMRDAKAKSAARKRITRRR